MIDLREPPERLALREEARAWLAENLPKEPLPQMDTPDGFQAHRAWDRKLFEAGYAAIAWPHEYGGRGASIFDWLAFEEEYYLSGAPLRVSQNGISLLAPAIFEFGTDEQRAHILPRIASAEDVWAQAWSESEAGSDLAALTATARRHDNGWILSGSKLWSSRGAHANRAFGPFRTGTPEDRHRALTYFLVALDHLDIHIRPISRLDGIDVFAEIHFDEAWVDDEAVLGPVDEGWRVAMSTAGSERGLLLRTPGRFLATAKLLVNAARRAGVDPDSVDGAAMAQAWADAQAYRFYSYANATRLADGESLGFESSINKLFWSEMDVRTHDAARQLLGSRSLLDRTASEAEDDGRWLEGFLIAVAGPIYGGSNEIQRDIVAERILHLPRGRRG